MRIIAGSAKGRRLRTLAGDTTRPTSDKVRGAIFSILASRYELTGARVLDLFSGSGALGIEALSRGADHVTFVEDNRAAQRVIGENLDLCRFAGAATLLRASVASALARLGREQARFDGVLLDPPYGKDHVRDALGAIAAAGLVLPGGWVLAEHHVDETPPSQIGGLELTQTRHYGKTAVTLFSATESMKDSPLPARPGVRAVYAGSFDPITNGHLDVIHRALNVFDEVIVAVANTTSDPKKSNSLFTAAERVETITECLADSGGRARADSFQGLLVDYCDQVGARVSIRGLRAVSDFEYEFQMAMMNRHLKPRIETVFMASSEAHFYTSSRLVKEVARLGGDVRGLLPDTVIRRLASKLKS